MLRKSIKFALPVLLGVLISTPALACPAAKDGTVKPSHMTSIQLHHAGDINEDLGKLVDVLLPVGSGYRVDTKAVSSGRLGRDLIGALETGELPANVIVTYGRTGETPPGRDILMHMHNLKAANLFGKLPKQFTLRSEFQKIADDVDTSGYISVPYIAAIAIFYNPALIERKDVPNSWKGLANFDGKIAVPGSGCFGMRTLVSLYHAVGAEKFEKIIQKADMPAMETTKDDPRESKDMPMGGTRTSIAVAEGDFKIGLGPLTSIRTQDLIASGAIGVIWPEEGAIPLPHLLAVRANPNEADIALANFIASNIQVRNVLLHEGISSTLRGGTVLPIIKENDFNFKHIPIKKVMDQDAHRNVIEIVERNKPAA